MHINPNSWPVSSARLVFGDSLVALSDGQVTIESVDAIVTDPPYELGFMGKKWDSSGIAYNVDLWREALRVLKPGGHLLAFGGTRTYHRMVCAIEDAGFEIRDSLHWIYGTGFPKSLNLGEGRGTALKPGHEPVVLARKPLYSTVQKNIWAYGTGCLNIDACRIESGGTHGSDRSAGQGKGFKETTGKGIYNGVGGVISAAHPEGRWPANVLFDEDAAGELDGQSGETKSSDRVRHNGSFKSVAKGAETARDSNGFSDTGGASRFFYVAKPSRKERDLGCEGLPGKSAGEATDREEGTDGLKSPRAGAGRTGGAKNYHPTVKPVTLMRYLVKLVTPPGGIVLDPFLGSGTTGMAAVLEGYQFIGIEKEAEYLEIASRRIAACQTTKEQ